MTGLPGALGDRDDLLLRVHAASLGGVSLSGAAQQALPDKESPPAVIMQPNRVRGRRTLDKLTQLAAIGEGPPLLRSTSRAVGLTSALALGVSALAMVSGQVPAHADQPVHRAADDAAPFSLWTPKKVTSYEYRNRTWTDFGLRLVAETGPLEVWSHRPSYDEGIQSSWRSASGDVALPPDSMENFAGISNFLTITVTPRKGGGDPLVVKRDACLNGYSERVRPSAPATSPYPVGCWYNPFSLGSVQGVQQGWASPVLSQGKPFKLGVGKYDVVTSISPRYAAAFGLTPDEASVSTVLTVTDQEVEPGGPGGPKPPHPVDRQARPVSHPPQGAVEPPADGPEPDLRSLPAWGISLNKNGTQLRFSATVWNAGDSPLVVDGFRRDGKDEMDAYQYFFDADGTQTGYQPVGHMHWDPKPSHQHWHFEDFARYSLLDHDKQPIAVSHKEAFCLANTDAVDLTVPDAAWRPENTNLATSCGDYSALSIREVLAAGWGDTYTQYRAGQSIPIRTLPDGTYYLAVVANPEGNLVEESTDNNTALRKIRLSTKKGVRTVTVPQVGIITEEGYGGTG
ncbi:lysyl oxidase family protein [Nocardioides sp. CN2-186]|uniref:lysyl oxidase family protein n=1 Tax=Nocardioides tweenelious TaxID=3156607 RepID=UPI0032B57376